jgi:hypothetical protein
MVVSVLVLAGALFAEGQPSVAREAHHRVSGELPEVVFVGPANPRASGWVFFTGASREEVRAYKRVLANDAVFDSFAELREVVRDELESGAP